MPTDKVLQDMAQVGGRHYRGGDRFRPKPWTCPACNAANTGPLEQGCVQCGAGKPGEKLTDFQRTPTAVRTDHRAPNVANAGSSLTEQLARRRQAPALSPGLADEIVSRIETILEEKLGGTHYSQEERAALFAALEVFCDLWENGEIQPALALALPDVKRLALRVAPGTLPDTYDFDDEENDDRQPDADPAPPEPEGPPDQQ